MTTVAEEHSILVKSEMQHHAYLIACRDQNLNY